MIVLAQIPEALNALDHASTQGDRWMLCLLLAAFGVIFFGMFRYFSNREEKREERFMTHSEKELAVSKERTEAVFEHNQLLKAMHEKLDKLMEARTAK